MENLEIAFIPFGAIVEREISIDNVTYYQFTGNSGYFFTFCGREYYTKKIYKNFQTTFNKALDLGYFGRDI